MDVVLLVTDDGQLQLFRLNWERLWTKQPGTRITSLQWRPDGKQVAYGDEDGNVVVLAAEDGSVVASRRVFVGHGGDSAVRQRGVMGLSWTVHRVDGADTRFSRSSRFLGHHSHEQGFSACSGTEASSHAYCIPASHNGHEVRSEWEMRLARRGRDEDRWLSMLCAVNAQGEGVVCGEGLLPVLAFRVMDQSDAVDDNTDDPGIGNQHHRNIMIRMSSMADQVWIGWRDGSGLHVSRVDTSVIGREALMIRSVVSLLSDTLKDVHMMDDVMRDVRGHMIDVETAREEHLKDMRGILGDMRDPEKDIYDFLVRGTYSLELKTFVGKEGALKTTARRIDSAMSCLYHDVVYHLQPCLERIAFRLGDIRGHSMTPGGLQVLGLRPEMVGAAERWALDFVTLAEHFRELALKAASGYRNLYALMSMLQHRELGEKYPSLPRSAVQEVEELIASRYYSSELEAIVGGLIGGRDAVSQVSGNKMDDIRNNKENIRQDDEHLLSAVFKSACEMRTGDHVEPSEACNPSSIHEDASANEKENDEGLDHLLKGLEQWLDGGISADYVDTLVEKKRAQVAHVVPPSSVPSPSPLDAFKTMLLDIVSCPAKALSSQAQVTHRWKILSNDDGNRTNPFSMALDEAGNLELLSASGACFLNVRLEPSDDAPVDIRGGRITDNQSITSCVMYEKSDAVLLTAVSPEGSHIIMVPLTDDALPVIRKKTQLMGPIDELISEAEPVDLAQCRSRFVPALEIMAPFAASATRGVALALFAPANTVAIYDLEEDDEDEMD